MQLHRTRRGAGGALSFSRPTLLAFLAAIIIDRPLQAGDSPGSMVSNWMFSNSGSMPLASVPAGLALREICESTELSTLLSSDANASQLLAIDANGTLRSFWGQAQYPRLLPPPGLGAIHWAGQSAGPRMYALRADGTLLQWSRRGPGYQPPGIRWKAVGLGGSNTVAGIALDGSLHSWDAVGLTAGSGGPFQGGPRTLFGIDPSGPYASLDLGRNWGIAVNAEGVARAFGIDAPLPGPVGDTPGVAEVSIWPTLQPPGTSPNLLNLVWLRMADGTVRNMSGSIVGPGVYSKISQPGSALYSILALRTDGGVDAYRQTAPSGWMSLPGRYRSVQLSDSGRVAFAIWDEDADRDGEPDANQILRGELPDLNADLIDDARQVIVDLRDGDGDGRPDLDQTSAITGNTLPSPISYFFTGFPPLPRREYWAASLRVRRGSEVVDRAFISIGQEGAVPQRTGATFHVWRDPNNDGDPVDAVELLAVPFAITGRRQAIDFAPLLLGQHGDILFAGYSWVREESTSPGPGMFCEPAPTSVPTDPFAVSRASLRMWTGYTDNVGMTPTRMLRRTVDWYASNIPPSQFKSGPMEQWSIGSQLPVIALASRRALLGDCDRSGMIDALEVSAASWASYVDADGDGFVDACQSDCDGDGTSDLDEIAAGAEDCDGDLLPDDCRGKEGAGDCDANGETDRCTTSDCDGNEVPDECDLADGAPDVNRNGVLDACERDCDHDGLPDASEITGGLEADCNSNGWIDRCESDDCDGDGLSDLCEIAISGDCNENRVPDECDIASGLGPWQDLDGNGIIDMCQLRSSLDCDGDGIADSLQFPRGVIDCDGTGVFDACERTTYDCDRNGLYDWCEIADGAPDCDADGYPDNEFCEGDSDIDGRFDDCEVLTGDFDIDGDIDAADLGLLLGVWGRCYQIPSYMGAYGDLDGDGCVAGADLGILLTRWGRLIE